MRIVLTGCCASSGISDTNFASTGYGSRWRACRRTFWQYFHPGVVSNYRLAQRTETTKVLAKLLESPARLRSHLRQLFSATMLKVLYDIDVTSEDDHHVQIVDDSLEAAALAIPGSFAVEAFPFLRHVPAWFPGANSQRLFLRSKQASLYLKHKPFDDVQQSVASGELHSCIVTRMLARASLSLGIEAASLPGDELDLLKVTCCTAFEGGADTTFSTLQGLFVALALNPHVQKKAQAELDAVVGPHRLPCHEDNEALLYVNAIIKEVLRWHNVLPMGIPHRTVEDDVFCGHFIPAGTTVLTNVWYVLSADILHDPDTYENPDNFCPERFLRDGETKPDVQDPQTIMFGFGRRKCPGRYFANDSLFITISSILHVFNITLPLDEHGDPIKVKYRQSHGFLSYPEDIRCTVRPRSAAAETFIRNAMTGIPAGCGESTDSQIG
ncbi:cytochrome P450 [Trametes elegans]|nr:cytochrome P450 [Trametes elegans]